MIRHSGRPRDSCAQEGLAGGIADFLHRCSRFAFATTVFGSPQFRNHYDEGALAKRATFSNVRFTSYPTETGADACTGKNHLNSDCPLLPECYGRKLQLWYQGKPAIATCVDEDDYHAVTTKAAKPAKAPTTAATSSSDDSDDDDDEECADEDTQPTVAAIVKTAATTVEAKPTTIVKSPVLKHPELLSFYAFEVLSASLSDHPYHAELEKAYQVYVSLPR
ncbi:hypothetical protein C8J56DRAFT_1026421 [Mycena floridula]|nr:hypothetical protein C8J56DRAFT_1026421 [Mycena floridula]